MGSHRQDGPSRGQGLEKERQQEPSERKAASQGLGEGPKSGGGGSQCPSCRGPSLEEGTKCLPGAHQVVISCSLQLESSLVEVRGADCEAG